MFSMLLTSVHREEAASWESRIDEYLGLLEAHSVSFDVTKLAFIRLQLLQKVDRLTAKPTTLDQHAVEISPPTSSEPVVVPPRASTCNQVEADSTNSFDPMNSWRVMTEDPFGDWGDLDWTSLLDLG